MPDPTTTVQTPTPSVVGRGAPAAGEPTAPALPDLDFFPADLPPPPAPAAPVAAAAPKHPAFLVGVARDLGIAQQDIDGATTAELQSLVSYVGRQVANEARSLRTEIVVARQPAPPAPPAPAEDEDEALLRELAPDLDERLVRVLRTGIGWKKRAEELEKNLGQVRQADQDREARTIYDTLDGAFEALGPEYEPLFGKGAAEGLAADSPELRRRLAAIRDTGLDLRKASPRAIAQKIKAAATSLFPAAKPSPYDAALPAGPAAAEPPNLAPASPRPRPRRQDGTYMSDAEIAATRQWRDGGLAKPTQRLNPPEPDGPSKATASVAQLLEEMAAGETQAGHSSSVQLADFPD